MKRDRNELIKFKKYIAGDCSVVCQIYSKQQDRAHFTRIVEGKLTSVVITTLFNANVQNKMDIGMTINPCEGGRRASNVREITFLFVDCDNGKYNLDRLPALPIAPHLVVQTSPENYHAYWRITGCSKTEFKQIQKQLAVKLETDEQITDAGRAMRAAGTLNWKRGKPFRTVIAHLNESAKPILLTTFIERMQLDAGEAVAPATVLADQHPNSSENATPTATPELRTRILQGLEHLPADDRSVWLQAGMAIHSADRSDGGYRLWRTWSKRSKKYDEGTQRSTWSHFKPNGGIRIETLFYLARRFNGGNVINFDEMSVAEMFIKEAHETLRYDFQNQEWLWYDGITWRVDPQSPFRMVHRFIKVLSESGKGALSEGVRRFRNTATFRGIVSQAEFDGVMHISAYAFDKRTDLFALENGVVNLTSGLFRQSVPGDYLRRKAGVKYEQGADCPVWKRFMREICCEDKDLYRFLRRALGYTLFGEAKEQVFFIAIGSGGNGKGTLMRTVQRIFGEYATSVAPNLLTSAYSGNAKGPSPALANLRGARLVICSELPTGRRFDEAFIKQYAGGDEITARATYGDVFSFKPEGKLWLSANDPPEMRADDEAMWRRVVPIPFNKKFVGAQRDNDLESKLAGEYPGIFNWLLIGAKEYATDGLGECTAVEKLKQKMLRDADSVLAWVSERCVRDTSLVVPSAVAYNDYLSLMKKYGRKWLSVPAFRASLDKKGFHPKRRSKTNVFIGLQIQQ